MYCCVGVSVYQMCFLTLSELQSSANLVYLHALHFAVTVTLWLYNIVLLHTRIVDFPFLRSSSSSLVTGCLVPYPLSNCNSVYYYTSSVSLLP